MFCNGLRLNHLTASRDETSFVQQLRYGGGLFHGKWKQMDEIYCKIVDMENGSIP